MPLCGFAHKVMAVRPLTRLRHPLPACAGRGALAERVNRDPSPRGSGEKVREARMRGPREVDFMCKAGYTDRLLPTNAVRSYPARRLIYRGVTEIPRCARDKL